MKRFSKLFFFVAIIGSFVLFGCTNNDKVSNEDELIPTEYEIVNTLDGLTTSAKENSITPTSIIILFDNQTDEYLLVGEAFTLEINKDGQWFQVPVVIEEEYAFTSIGYDIQPNDVTEWTVDWEWLYGQLDSGEYRLIQEVLDVNEPGDFEEYWLATEFSLE